MIREIFKKKETIKYTLEQFIKLNLIVDMCGEDTNRLYLEVSKLLFGSDISKISKLDADVKIKEFIDTLQHTPLFVQRFTLNGVEYGFIPNLDKMSVGEYIDLDEYLKDGINSAHRVMSILYRPITKKFGSMYRIEDYEGTSKYSDIMLKSSYDIYLSSLVFFYHLGMSLSNYINTSILTETEKVQKRVKTLTEI